MKPNDLIIKEIDELVSIVEKLSHDAMSSQRNLGEDRVQELSATISRGGQLISRLYEPGNHFQKNLDRIISNHSGHLNMMHANNYRHISELAGLFKGVQHDIKSGLLSNVRRLLQAEIFADFLEMADYLLNEDYKDAAAVLIGGVLEDTLRKLADSHGVATTKEDGRPLTIEPLNMALAKADVYDKLIQKQITSWANLRNDAAHGHYVKYDKEQVKMMLLFVQKFASDYLQ